MGGDVERRSSTSSKRDRDRDDDRKGRSKHRRKRSRSSSTSSSSSSSSRSRSRERRKHRKSKLAEHERITSDDYYRRSAEFRSWLRGSRGIYLDEVSGQEARALFDKFVSKWNSGRLPSDVYSGAQAASGERTRHVWGFVDASDTPKWNVSGSAVGVGSGTGSGLGTAGASSSSTASASSASASASASGSGASSSARRHYGVALPPPSHSAAYSTSGFDLPDDPLLRRNAQSSSDRAARKHHEMVLEELVPKATGREAMLERKRERAAYTKRSRSPDMREYTDAELMGGGDDYKERLRAQRRAEERRETQRFDRREQAGAANADKLRAMQEREQGLLMAFREMAKNHKMG